MQLIKKLILQFYYAGFVANNYETRIRIIFHDIFVI